MINPKDIRIGNFLKTTGTLGVESAVYEIYSDGLHLMGNGISNRFDQVEGIPLTEEWLKKFGFVNLSSGYYGMNGFPFKLNFLNDSQKSVCFWSIQTKEPIRSVRFAHQLQNL